MDKMDKAAKSRWLYGVNPALEALRAGRRVEFIYIYAGKKGARTDELRAEAEARGVKVKIIHDREFFDRKFSKGNQGVAAAVEPRQGMSIEDMLGEALERPEPAFIVMLDQVEDPRNLGAVIRTAEAAGAHGIVVQEHRAAGLTPEAVKASAGASEHMPFAEVTNLKNAMRTLKDAGLRIVGAEADGTCGLWEAGLTGPLALVVGSEGQGLRRTVRELCDEIVTIPMRGKVNSLNTSVAAALVIYEVLRQRGE